MTVLSLKNKKLQIILKDTKEFLVKVKWFLPPPWYQGKQCTNISYQINAIDKLLSFSFFNKEIFDKENLHLYYSFPMQLLDTLM